MNEFFSPDQRYKVSLASNEIRMSHWIDQPYLIRVSDNVTLFSLDSLWSGDDVKWINPSTVTMHLRLYPGLLSCEVTLDAETNQGWVKGQPGAMIGTLPEVRQWINNLKNPSRLYR
ncbi:hypothetical protein [Spirosoma panaciterrae]|uniref:hypothetical protein n=1 Tax=Spirosoma panaciterrae TaxID=496058 RepID=UPI00037F5496|nr:hypothetical protein [Spirosoma panaciterrae]